MLSVTAESQYVTHVCPTSEDVFVVPEIVAKTPRKILGPCTASSTENQQNMGPLTTPTKGMEVASGEPWTPTSNLKMLISAASPDIRNREKELCNDNDGEETLEPSQDTEMGEETEKLSRKEKSLGLLCHKFLARYPDYPDPLLNNGICLDDVATELNVERRRIYDIMNVLESLHMVSRSAKNRYIWRGRSKLTQTLAILRQVGEQQRYAQQMQHIRLLQSLDKAFNLDGDDKENEEAEADAEGAGELGQKEMFFVELPGVEFKAASVNSRKDKSLRVMSQKFVMLFLVSSPPVVSLEVAAKILIGEDNAADQDKSKVKTKVRRLYDIANILRSLKLIEKVHVTTEEKGRKPAFEWIGPLEFPQVTESEVSAHGCSEAATKRVLESRTSKENCAKNLFSSPRSKTSFTRHPSLMKLAKSIQEDRRKITSAPSSPVKDSLCDSRNSDFPSKMAQLAAICQIQRDLQSKAGDRSSKAAVAPEPVAAQTTGSQQEARVNNTNATHLTPQTPQPPAPPPPVGPGVSYIRAHCPPLIPMLLPQPGRGAGSYAVYLHPSSLRGHHHHHHLAKPQPTSLAVRSMTFEDKSGQSPTGHSPAAAAGRPASRAPESSSPSAVKRPSSDPTADGSPSKAKRVEDASPKLCEILQARLAPRGHHHLSSRPSPRALHKDPEFLRAPGNAVVAGTALGANQTLEQSVETFLEKEDRAVSSDSEAGLTPLRAVPCTPSGHTETLVPAGYLFPISQQSLLGYKDLHALSGEGNRAPTPTYNIYHTPTAGSRPPLVQEVTPTGLRLHRFPAASPLSSQGQRLLSPSPAILNFTLQNLGLIQAPGPGQTPERTTAGTLASPLHPAHLGGLGRMVFIKPMSPVPIQQTVHGQPLTLISVQQSLMATPKGTGVSQPSFFHTPVSLSPLATVVTTSSPTTATSTTVYIPQRKLEVSPKGS